MRSEQQVEAALKSYEDVDSWKTIIFLYNAALKEVGTKLEILNDEFQHVHQYNPIEHIKTRIKTPDSIVKKLKRYGHETSIENMVRYVNDIAGVRLICSFTSDRFRSEPLQWTSGQALNIRSTTNLKEMHRSISARICRNAQRWYQSWMIRCFH